MVAAALCQKWVVSICRDRKISQQRNLHTILTIRVRGTIAVGVGVAVSAVVAALAFGESGRVTQVTNREQGSSVSFVRAARVFLTATANDGPRVDRNVTALTAHVETHCPLLMAQRVEGRPVEARAKAAVLAQVEAQVLVAVTVAMRQPVRTFVRKVELLRWGDIRTTHAIYRIVRADETALTLQSRDLCADAQAALVSHSGELSSTAQRSIIELSGAFPDGSLADTTRLLPGLVNSGRREADELQQLERALRASIAPRISHGLSRLEARLGLSEVSLGSVESIPAISAGE